jgi:hypothetical protein
MSGATDFDVIVAAWSVDGVLDAGRTGFSWEQELEKSTSSESTRSRDVMTFSRVGDRTVVEGTRDSLRDSNIAGFCVNPPGREARMGEARVIGERGSTS